MNLDAIFNGLAKAWQSLPEAVFAFLLGYLLIKLSIWFLHKILKIARVHKEFSDIIESFSGLLLWVILIASVAQILGFSKIAIAISSSIALVGFGVATGSNTLIADIISGIYLARDRDFRVGSEIKFGDIEGTIEKIDMRKIRVLTKKGDTAVIANSAFDRGVWIIYKQE